MEEELRSLREQLDYSRRLFGLQCEELFDLRARVAELEGLRAPGEHAQSSEPSEPSEASKKRAEEVRVLKRDKLMAVIANKSLRAEAERSRDEARDAKHSREMMEALLTENRAERIILGVDKDTATQTPGPPLDESARQGKIMRMMCACACNSSIDKGSLVELGCGHMRHVCETARIVASTLFLVQLVDGRARRLEARVLRLQLLNLGAQRLHLQVRRHLARKGYALKFSRLSVTS